MRLDAHQHFTAVYTPDLLLPILKRNRFEGGVVVCRAVGGTASGPVGGTPQGSDDTAWHFQLAAAHDFIRGVVAWADLDDPGIGALLDEYQRHPKFRGLTGPINTGSPDTGSPDAESTDTEHIGRGLAELEARDLTFDLDNLALVPEIAGRYSRLRIVIDHLGRPPVEPSRPPAAGHRNPFEAWARALERAAQHPLVFGKLSGLITHCPTRWKAEDFRPYVQHALRTLGPHRLMFGSDWPSYLPEGTFKESLAAFTQSIGALPIEMREDLLGGTAERAYAL
ncbi:MAG TPA: amidohydrolase family protein [Candidatus Acidoferrales bacterium]|nr:amidohydrolase family protein [Candidatus Acidoferrales bacterium]